MSGVVFVEAPASRADLAGDRVSDVGSEDGVAVMDEPVLYHRVEQRLRRRAPSEPASRLPRPRRARVPARAEARLGGGDVAAAAALAWRCGESAGFTRRRFGGRPEGKYQLMRKRLLLAVAMFVLPRVWRWARPRLQQALAGTSDSERIKERMTEPLPETQLSGPAPTPEAFIDSEARDSI